MVAAILCHAVQSTKHMKLGRQHIDCIGLQGFIKCVGVMLHNATMSQKWNLFSLSKLSLSHLKVTCNPSLLDKGRGVQLITAYTMESENS